MTRLIESISDLLLLIQGLSSLQQLVIGDLLGLFELLELLHQLLKGYHIQIPLNLNRLHLLQGFTLLFLQLQKLLLQLILCRLDMMQIQSQLFLQFLIVSGPFRLQLEILLQLLHMGLQIEYLRIHALLLLVDQLHPLLVRSVLFKHLFFQLLLVLLCLFELSL